MPCVSYTGDNFASTSEMPNGRSFVEFSERLQIKMSALSLSTDRASPGARVVCNLLLRLFRAMVLRTLRSCRPITSGSFSSKTWKQSAATGFLKGLALDFLSTIIPVVRLCICLSLCGTFGEALEPWTCLAQCRRAHRGSSITEFDLRAPCRKDPHLSSNTCVPQKCFSRHRVRVVVPPTL